MVVDAYINTILDIEIENIVTNLEEVENSLQKCFCLGLTLDPYSSQYTLTYNELIELIRVIDKKGAVPAQFNKNMSTFETKQ